MMASAKIEAMFMPRWRSQRRRWEQCGDCRERAYPHLSGLDLRESYVPPVGSGAQP